MNTDSLFQLAHVKQHFGRAAERYAASAALQKEVEARLLELADYLPAEPQRVLDLGCGPGRGAGLLKKRWPKAELIAMDLALPMLQQVPKHTRFWRPVKRVCGNAMQLPFKDNSFDFIFSSLCLQWAHPLPEALQEIRRVLRPDGMLAFSTFGPDTLIEKPIWPSAKPLRCRRSPPSSRLVMACRAAAFTKTCSTGKPTA